MTFQPQPLFDQPEYLEQPHTASLNDYLNATGIDSIHEEFNLCRQFLLDYRHSPDTFNAYRRDLERLCQWAWHIQAQPLCLLTRNNILAYIAFAQSPPAHWISHASAARFITRDQTRRPNPKWRPFLKRAAKVDHQKGTLPQHAPYRMTDATLRALFANISSFYTFLQQEQRIQYHPVQSIRQKNRFLKKTQVTRMARTLSPLQWKMVLTCTQEAARTQPEFERHLFVLSMFYLLGLRISELVPTHRHTPSMSDFFKDTHNRWWFVTLGKGNKEREIAVPKQLLEALIRYRSYLKLSTRLPVRGETTPLIPKYNTLNSIGLRQLRHTVQASFDLATEALTQQGEIDEADALCAATTHWLRHTAISADVQHRPREHVRDDAGHDNLSTTDRYIDTERQARHASAEHKTLLADTVVFPETNTE